jgi:transposase InsO family protein
VIDAHSRRVIGWAIADHMRTDLVEDALRMAIVLRGERPAKVVFHADRGTQYASGQIARFAATNGITRSMGRTGVCWDNAMAESFFATLKTEFYYRRVWPTKAGAARAVGAWIEDRSRYAGDLHPGRWDRGGRVTSSIGARPWPSHPAWSARHVLAEAS